MIAPVDYKPDLLTPEQADLAFDALDRELPWGRRNLPRDEVYFNDHPVPYTYGSPGREHTYLPEPQWHPIVLLIREDVERWLLTLSLNYDVPMDVCFLNRYVGPRDQLGWHADDSPEMNPEACIVTVSLGAERDIMFRTPLDTVLGKPLAWTEPERLLLAHGSAASMQPGMQQSWQHRIPKSSRSDIGTRISLTFRGYLSPEDDRLAGDPAFCVLCQSGEHGPEVHRGQPLPEVEKLARAIVAGQEVAVTGGRSVGREELHKAVAARVKELTEVEKIDRRYAENMADEIERERLGPDYYDRED